MSEMRKYKGIYIQTRTKKLRSNRAAISKGKVQCSVVKHPKV